MVGPNPHHARVPCREGKDSSQWKPRASCVPFHGGDFTCLHATSSPLSSLALLMGLPVISTSSSQPFSLPSCYSLPRHLIFALLSGGYFFPVFFSCTPLLSSLPLSVSPTCALMVPLTSLYFYPSDTPLVSTSLSVSPTPLLQYWLWVPISWCWPRQCRAPPGFSLPLAAPNERGVE